MVLLVGLHFRRKGGAFLDLDRGFPNFLGSINFCGIYGIFTDFLFVSASACAIIPNNYLNSCIFRRLIG